jgi:hypothetical protein
MTPQQVSAEFVTISQLNGPQPRAVNLRTSGHPAFQLSKVPLVSFVRSEIDRSGSEKGRKPESRERGNKKMHASQRLNVRLIAMNQHLHFSFKTILPIG